jgi:DNA repair exonuclease SbcCD ATPase subunit
VVSGRNGAGKSTIFDAFEFALIGEISKFPALKEGQESARDYYWWRGQGDVGPKYVSLIFEGADGSSFPLTRKPEDRPEDRDRTFAGAACNMPVTDGDPISALVRTSLIRDETITAFGLDLTEIQRFSFVQSALNLERGTHAVESVRQAREIAKRRLSDAQTYRARLQEELNQRLTQLSEARASLAKEDEITASLKRLQLLLGRTESDISTILQYSHHSVAHWRVMIGNLEVVLERLTELGNTWNELDELREQIAFTSHAKKEAESQYVLSSSTLDKARSNLEVEKRRDALATSLSFF